jgi:hypothetical protein
MTKTIFAGMTEANCCDDCNIDGCVISGRPYCAHPRKGGLHAPQMQDHEALKRYRMALATLDRAAAEDKLKRAAAAMED